MPRARLVPTVRRWLRRCLLLCPLLFAGGSALSLDPAGAKPASAAIADGPIAQQVNNIEARFGDDMPELLRRLTPVEAAARASGGDDLRVFLAAWGYVHAALDKVTVAEAAIAELLILGERERLPLALASAYALRATMLQFSGRIDAAYGWIDATLPLIETSDDAALRYWVFMTAGDLASFLGRLDLGRAHFEAADAAAAAQGNRRRRAQAFVALAPVKLAMGDVVGARLDAARAFGLAAAAEVPSLMLAASLIEAQAALHAGDAAAASKAAQRGQELAYIAQRHVKGEDPEVNPQAGGPRWLGSQLRVLQQLSGLYLSAGNFEQASRAAARGLQLAALQRDSEASALASINQGMAWHGLRRHAQGRKSAEQGLAWLRQRGKNVELLQELNRYGQLLERVGDPSGALRHLREALALESELVRKDKLGTVLDLQQQFSQAAQQREREQLAHQTALLRSGMERQRSERLLSLGLAGTLGLGVVLTAWLYLRVRRANTDLRSKNAELEFVSLHDRVTGLPNRRAIERDTEALQDSSFVGLGIGIKRFGLIMGSLGHVLGDALLCQVGERLEAVVLRRGGTLYRLDGLSFGVICRGNSEQVGLESFLLELTEAIAPSFCINQQQLTVTLSIGAAEYPKDGRTPADIARAIQFASHRAREQAGTRAVVFSEGLMSHQHERLLMETRLSQALERGEFELHYQAQCRLSDRRLSGFEALLRWRSVDGLIPPDRFIPLAEASGLIVPIGRWVLQQACAQARAWQEAGLGEPMVAVNISPRQFQHPEFMDMVRQTLQSSGVNPGQMELEITEGAVMDEADGSTAQLHALRALGLHLAIDDFGTGYSSLAYLRRFPINRLKIDRSFITDLMRRSEDAAIVQALIQLSHSLGLTVVAEGVEDLSQEACLRDWGCDLMQGYVYARPVPAAQASEMLRQAQTSLVVSG
ncbi:bifunctional diguanylate cyclase/phosphodiesterase [Paucibacter sp. DJ1R-11]|uniref:putative bifunctional diguanylate cyclase/phosphodiesterase n=1 Tax=Paucibacter sp. DJ1R-11 TaxID=2893556 RepID=UPI0021E4F057|nr:bifunctional diguanylate cyclase/phosphodiesterase [Paucibacter sp. DJ1R-11]MCV2365958.1 bifunctional diguanylate cyclase/phosphodiesterase [Paucibacter sp. DJ1R-11]